MVAHFHLIHCLAAKGKELACRGSDSPYADATARQAMANLPYDQMHAPVLGPAHPYQKDGVAAGMRNHRAGHVEVSTAVHIGTACSQMELAARPNIGELLLCLTANSRGLGQFC